MSREFENLCKSVCDYAQTDVNYIFKIGALQTPTGSTFVFTVGDMNNYKHILVTGYPGAEIFGEWDGPVDDSAFDYNIVPPCNKPAAPIGPVGQST